MARVERAAVAQTLKTVRGEIKSREAVLAEIGNDIAAKRKVREEIDAQIAVEAQKYQAMQARLDQVADKLGRAIPAEPSAPAKKPAAPTPPARKGFSLRRNR